MLANRVNFVRPERIHHNSVGKRPANVQMMSRSYQYGPLSHDVPNGPVGRIAGANSPPVCMPQTGRS